MENKNQNNVENCIHDIVWGTRWLGVFPKTKKGVCKLCGKQFEMKNEEIKQKEVENK